MIIGPPRVPCCGLRSVMKVAAALQLHVAGVGSTLPAASVARTWNVCCAAVTVYALGLVQAANAEPSRLHSNVAVSVALKVKVTLTLPGALAGPALMSVFGGTVSTVHDTNAAELELPA